MIERNLGEVDWVYTYEAENRLVEVEKDGVTENRYYYDGDGNRVARLGADNKGTIFIGKYFEAAYPHYSIPDPPPPVTAGGGGENEPNTVNLLPQGDITYYYASSQRIAMRDAWGVHYLLSDHLGSSSVVVNQAGIVEERAYYLPWGGNRGGSVTITDYGYTGQMKEGDIYFYNSRWYDPELGRFMQADTIVPLQVQGTQAFDRYAYVNNNPLRYTDTSGNYIINGWNESYLQRQDGNTCGVVSLAMGLSVLYQKQVTQADLQSRFPQTTPTKLFSDGLGVPPGQLAITTNIVFGQGVKATRYTGGTVEELKQNIYENKPTLVLIQLPEPADVGHYLLAIGYTEEEGFTFADPHGDIWRTEQDFVDRWGKERGFSSFKEVWSQDYWPVLQPNTMITLEYNTGATYGTFLQYVNYQNPIRLTGRWDHREEIR